MCHKPIVDERGDRQALFPGVFRTELAGVERIMKIIGRPARSPAADLERAAGDYWDMSDVNERIRDQSHWYGEGRWGRERWLAYGDFVFARAGKLLQEAAGGEWPAALHGQTALEWGCGGGAIVRPLCDHFGLVYGVDISKATLRECRKRVREFAGKASAEKSAGKDMVLPRPPAGTKGNFRDLHFSAERPEDLLAAIAPGTIDFIISIGVFKHFPSQAYTLRVLRIMEKLLKPGGYLYVQIRYFDGEEKYRSKDRDYARNVITMTSFTEEEFAVQIAAAGLILRHRERDGDGENEKHAYYFLGKAG